MAGDDDAAAGAAAETPTRGTMAVAEEEALSAARSHAEGVVSLFSCSQTIGGLLQQIQKLKAEQKAARERRKVVNKELKNAERRKRRLKTRAWQLTNDDLLEVMMLRGDARASTAPSSPDATMTQAGVSASLRADV